jgi:hypothetical protein
VISSSCEEIYSQWLAEQSTDERVLDDYGVEFLNMTMQMWTLSHKKKVYETKKTFR